jgi:hypothetical protein
MYELSNLLPVCSRTPAREQLLYVRGGRSIIARMPRGLFFIACRDLRVAIMTNSVGNVADPRLGLLPLSVAAYQLIHPADNKKTYRNFRY